MSRAAAWCETHEPDGGRRESGAEMDACLTRSDVSVGTRAGVFRTSAVSVGRKLDEQTDDTREKTAVLADLSK